MEMAVSLTRWRQGVRWLGGNSVWPYLLLLGVILLGFGTLRGSHILGCSQWPTVTGEVVRCELERGLMREGVAQARLAMTYAYTVDGRRYEGHRLSFAGNKANYDELRAMLKQYRQGTPVTVHHHPGDPGHAVLDTAFSWRGFAPLFYGSALILVAILGLVRGWRLTSANWFDAPAADRPPGKMRFEDALLGLLGLLTIAAIPFLWWALIKMYAGH